MKNIREIVARSIILLCLSDRCALEKTIIGGKSYTKKQRIQQQLAINEWMAEKGYDEYLTENEKEIFELEIGCKRKNEILSYQNQHESIETFLWAVNLVEKLSNYDDYVFGGFSPYTSNSGFT